jgi:hypothetical protein
MVLTLISRSPRGPGFLAPVARKIICELDTSVGVSGPHDFAYAPAPSVRTNRRARRQGIHRIPASRVVTIAMRPSSSRRDVPRMHNILKNGISIFFIEGLDSRISVETPHEFRFFAHGILTRRRPRSYDRARYIGQSGRITCPRLPLQASAMRRGSSSPERDAAFAADCAGGVRQIGRLGRLGSRNAATMPPLLHRLNPPARRHPHVAHGF